MRGLKDKAAIVTGGSTGIGRAILERLCQEGVSVTYSGISDGGIQTEEECVEKGYQVQFVQGDMGEEAFCQRLTQEAISKWGRVNFLVNNAFSFIAKGLEATREDWLRMMKVGPLAYATMARCVVESMNGQGGGAIVNLSSISAHIAQPDRWTYNSAKGAVNQLTRCMALDLAQYNIRVNTVSPGWIWTREVDKAAGGDRQKWGPIWGKFHMLRRLGEVEECAGPVAFLLSDEASFVTAAELLVDGGYHGMGQKAWAKRQLLRDRPDVGAAAMSLVIGVLLVIAGGALEGLFSLPVTRTPKWQWENIWGLGSLVALILVPWPVAFLTVPELTNVYREASPGVLTLTLLFGIGWGVGGIFWGKAIAAVGVALGVSLLMGLINVFGSPVLLAFTEPGKLIDRGGLTLLAAVAVMLIGVVLCATAGARKEKELNSAAKADADPNLSTPFAVGLSFCIISGVLSAMVNFGFVFGEPIAAAATKAGATQLAANNAVWALVFTGNYAVNAIYAFWLMVKNQTLGLIFSEGTLAYWCWAVFMGIAWPLGIVLYGIGAVQMGNYGAFVGFPMMLVMAILFGNLAGALTGEWQGTSAKTRFIMVVGVGVLFVAFAIFGGANSLLNG